MDNTRRVHNQTASERKDTIIDAAIAEFALKGLHGTATEDIARRAGISQPYVFRLFNTKRDLFIAAAERVHLRISQLFEHSAAAARESGDDVLQAMGRSYNELLGHREELLLLLQMFAASDDPEVRMVVGGRFEQLYEQVQRLAGIDADVARSFFAIGMLCTVVTAIDRPRILGFEDWPRFFEDCQLPGNRLFTSMAEALQRTSLASSAERGALTTT